MKNILDHLYRIEKAISKATTLRETCDIILKRGLPVVKAHSGQLKVINPDQNRLVTIASWNVKEPPEEARKPVTSRGVCGRAAKTGKYVYITNLDMNRAHGKKLAQYAGTEYGKHLQRRKSQLAIPLKIRNEIVGVLDVHSHRYEAFSVNDIRFLEFLATRAAAAVGYANAFKRISTLQQISDSISGQLDLLKLLQTIQQEIERLIPVLDTTCILISDTKTQQLLPFFRCPYIQPNGECTHCTPHHPVIRDALKTQTIALTHREEPREAEQKKPLYHFEVAMPMIWNNVTVGVVTGRGLTTEPFSQLDQELWMRISRVTAKAVYTARRYAEVENEIEQRRFELEVLGKAGQIINSSQNLAEVLSLIMTEGLKILGERNKSFFIALYDPQTQELVTKVGGGEFFKQEMIGQRQSIQSGIMGWVFRNQAPYLSVDIHQDKHYVERLEKTLSEFAVPLIHNNTVLGVLDLESTDLNDFDEEHQFIIKSLANYAAIAIRNAQLYDEVRDQERIKQELRIARQIQHHLLPATAPHFPTLNVAALALSAREVGGDFYDFIDFQETPHRNKLGIVIADVSGKGIPAGIVMATSKSVFQIQALSRIEPAAVMQESNHWLVRNLQKDMFVAAAYAVIDTQHKRMEYSIAGQPLPLLIRAGTEIPLDSMEPRYPLGFRANIPYSQRAIQLQTGDILIFYTDGLIEATNKAGELYDLHHLTTIVNDNPNRSPADIIQLIIKDVKRFTKTIDQSDDLTLVVIQVC